VCWILLKVKLKNLIVRIPTLSNNVVARVLTKTGITQDYQPLLSGSEGMRSCTDRLEVIKKNIRDAELCLDVGCNTGFFSYEISKMGIFTIGLESELKNVIVAGSQYCGPNIIYKQYNLDKASVGMLPRADVVLFLSVFHHLVKYYGKDDALFVLKKLASKCSKQFFFETGQPDELGTRWAHKMEFIEDVDEWAHDFFVNECQFKEVKYLGAYETFLTTTKRKLFLALR